MYYNMSNNNKHMTDTSMTDPRGWAVQPATWFNFDPDGCVYCADLDTAYRVAQDQTRYGSQMIYKMTAGDPIKWIRVNPNETVEAENDILKVLATCPLAAM